MSSSDTNQSANSGAIYHHVSPTVILIYRVTSGLGLLFALSSILITLIQGGVVSPSFFLHTLNLLLICALVGQLWWWYKTGDLSEDRIYVVFAAMGALAFQCLTTIIWVFNYQLYPGQLVPGTVPPVTVHTALPNTTGSVTVTPINMTASVRS